MRIGRVVGRVVATRKDPLLAAQKLLLVQPLDGDGRVHGTPLVLLDAVGAGADEVVFYVRGREATFAFLPQEVVTDGVIAGIVDHYQVDGRMHSGITEVGVRETGKAGEVGE